LTIAFLYAIIISIDIVSPLGYDVSNI